MAVVYLERDGQQFGPFSIEEAQGYILEGRFGAQDLGWIDGMQEWLSVAQIPQLRTAAAPTTSPSSISPSSVSPSSASTPYAAPTMPAPPPAYSPYAAPVYPGQLNQGVAAAKDLSQSEYAGFWRRAAALMIDTFIVTIVVYFLMFVLMLLFGLGMGASGMTGLGSNSATANAFAVAAVAFPALLTISYYALFNASSNMATPGKMAAGLVVVNTQAQRISFAQACLREFVKLIGTWFFLLTFVTQPISARRQAIHDFASTTVVLRQRPDAGMPSVLVWLINLCWAAALFMLVAIVIAFQH